MPGPRANVVYILYRFPQVSQTFVRDEIHALRDLGLQVDVLSLYDPGPSQPSGAWSGPHTVATVPSLVRRVGDIAWWLRHHPRRFRRFLTVSLREPGHLRYALTYGPSLARQLDAPAPDQLHTHFAWKTSTLVAGLAILLNRSCSITVHAKDIYAQPVRQVRRRLSLFDGIVTVCYYNVGYLEGAHALPTGAASPRVVPCGVATEADLTASPTTIDVLAVGRLVPKKGFDVLLRGLALLRPAFTGTAVIVGDGPERAALERLAAELGLGAHVQFLGAKPHEQVLATMGESRVFCLPSRPSSDGDSDAMPVVIREAMARGVPVIATRLAGIPESVDDEVGWLVDHSSPSALSHALEEALRDHAESRRRGRNGYERAREKWRFNDQARQLVGLFDEFGRSHESAG